MFDNYLKGALINDIFIYRIDICSILNDFIDKFFYGKEEVTKGMKRFLNLLASYTMAFLVIVAVVFSIMPINVQAASKASDAKNAYNAFLKKSVYWGDSYKKPSRLKFALVDLNNDKVPELYVYSMDWDYNYDYKLYGYVGGKVKCLYSFRRFSKISKFYPSKGVFVYYGEFNRGVKEKIYFKYDGKKAVQKARSCISELYNSQAYESSVNKNISKSKFNSTVKKLVGSASAKSVPGLYQNNSANREKYLGASKQSSKMALNKKSISISVGKTATLKLSGASGRISWSSKNKRIATVSSKGIVKGKGVGTTIIIAEYKGKSYQCKVKVKSLFKEVCMYPFSNGGFYFWIKEISGNKMRFSVNMPEMHGDNMTAKISSDGKHATASFLCPNSSLTHNLKISLVKGGIKVTENSYCSSMLLATSESQKSKYTLTRTFYPGGHFYN